MGVDWGGKEQLRRAKLVEDFVRVWGFVLLISTTRFERSDIFVWPQNPISVYYMQPD